MWVEVSTLYFPLGLYLSPGESSSIFRLHNDSVVEQIGGEEVTDTQMARYALSSSLPWNNWQSRKQTQANLSRSVVGETPNIQLL